MTVTLRAATGLLLILLVILPSAVPAETNGRLDSPVIPEFQTITLDLDATRKEYSGSVRIDVRVTAQTRIIEFHAEEMTLDRAELRGADGGVTPLECEMREGGFVTATAAENVAPGEYVLEIDFSKDYNTKAVGLYRVEKDGLGYLFSQFEDIAATRVHEHLIPGHGAIDFPEVLEAISATEYDGWLTVELYPYLDDPDAAGREAREHLLRLMSR